MKIGKCETKYGVKVLSTNDRIDLDTSDPNVIIKRAFEYMMANKKLFNIPKRAMYHDLTRTNRYARHELLINCVNGRLISVPPFRDFHRNL
ncbi:hypothetical protein EA772_16050 [Pedobacter sp. G11]|uniref:hypothetical protein n=1 Tax=Pedobacter sp. G11 TaxID=2482728 RepID=UPI000F5D7888|nr:hypothetical protein [Pedobacter sp. G11]AZI26773.1 hypothetical protein EA772_16050 [Pedobacter sp. G11]